MKPILKEFNSNHWSHIQSQHIMTAAQCGGVLFKPQFVLLQLLKKLSRLLYNIVVLFIPWEVRIKKIESESSFLPSRIKKIYH